MYLFFYLVEKITHLNFNPYALFWGPETIHNVSLGARALEKTEFQRNKSNENHQGKITGISFFDKQGHFHSIKERLNRVKTHRNHTQRIPEERIHIRSEEINPKLGFNNIMSYAFGIIIIKTLNCYFITAYILIHSNLCFSLI